MPHPEDYLRACNCATWQEAQQLIEIGHPDEAVLFAAWHAVAMLAPPIEVHELFSTGQAPERPYLIWQNRYDKAALLANRKRAEAEAIDLHLHTIEDMLAAVLDKSQPTARRIAAIVAIGQMRHRPAILPLLSAMYEEPLANACAHALIAIGSRRHLRQLVKLLKPNTPDYLKQEAIYCLWMLGDRRGANSLARIALDRTRESDQTRLMATEALGNNVRKPFIQRILAQAVLDPYVGVLKSALCAVGRLHDLPLLQVLRRAMESRLHDPEVIYESTFGEQVHETLQELYESSGPRRLGRDR